MVQQPDPRLSDENVAMALDAIGDFLDATDIRGVDLSQQRAIRRFRQAWPKPTTEPAPSNGATPEA